MDDEDRAAAEAEKKFEEDKKKAKAGTTSAQMFDNYGNGKTTK